MSSFAVGFAFSFLFLYSFFLLTAFTSTSMPLTARNFSYADNERLMNGSSHFHPWEGEGGWPEKRLCYIGEEALFSFSSWWKALCSPREELLFWCNDPCFRDEFVVCSDENDYFILTCVIMVYSAITLFI